MLYIENLKNFKIYRKPLILPYNVNSKKKGSCYILVTPNLKSSARLMYHGSEKPSDIPFINKYCESYYLERKLYFLTDDDHDEELDEATYNKAIELLESGNYNEILNEVNRPHVKDSYMYLKKIFYKERLKTKSDLIDIYAEIQSNQRSITRVFPHIEKYRGFNIFYDFYLYNELFQKNNPLTKYKAMDLYLEVLDNFINDENIKDKYPLRTIIVPVIDWKNGNRDFYKYTAQTNIISAIAQLLRIREYQTLVNIFKNLNVLFIGDSRYFKMNFSELDLSDRSLKHYSRFTKQIIRLADNLELPDDDEDVDTDEGDSIENKKREAIEKVTDILERRTPLKINNLLGSSGRKMTSEELKKVVDKSEDDLEEDNEIINSEKLKDEIVDTISKEIDSKIKQDPVEFSKISTSQTFTDELLDMDQLQSLVFDAIEEEDDTIKLTAARSKRIAELDKAFKDTWLSQDKRITPRNRNIVDNSKINIPNKEEWVGVNTYALEDEEYDAAKEAVNMVYDIINKDKKYPIHIKNVNIEDTSTSEDWKNTISLSLEDNNGNRFTTSFDVPILKDNAYPVIGGNEKVINKQLMLLPISKTDNDTVQIVSNYSKIFIIRTGNKIFEYSNKIIRVLNEVKDIKGITFKKGDSTISNKKYDVPFDYNELSTEFLYIETDDFKIYLNQKELLAEHGIRIKKRSDAFPIGIHKKTNTILWCKYTDIFSLLILDILSNNDKFKEEYNKLSDSKSYAYSSAKIMDSKVPLIVVLCLAQGLSKTLNEDDIKYNISSKLPKNDMSRKSYIRFKDGYLIYDNTYESSLLLNGLKKCNTMDYSIANMDDKKIYLDFLDLFGGRKIADGLDNFKELMIDSETFNVLQYYSLPSTYTKVLLHANKLLCNNNFTKHTDLSGYRIRGNKVINGYMYKAIADAYKDYKFSFKRNPKTAKFSMKKSAVIDAISTSNIVSDNSTLTTTLEAETLNTISTKGPSGMNSERAYKLDKRAYDETMINILGMSTANGPGVGINRQLAIGSKIENNLGILKIKKDPSNINHVDSVSVSEALTPMSVMHNDPPRTAMNLMQSKHMMRVEDGDPLLIDNGISEALPYMLPNTFAYKAKDDGFVKEMSDNFMIVEYNNGNTDVINISNQIKKNSSSGFYVPLKLDTSLKPGDKFKINDILAHDKKSFRANGPIGNMANINGPLAKVAILFTDYGYEDSVVVDRKLADRLKINVVMNKDIVLEPQSNIYNMKKIGDVVNEGDSLLVFQNAYDDDSVNILLKNLATSEEELTDIGRIPVKSPYTGRIVDIKLYRTVELDTLSPSLKKLFTEYERNIKKDKDMITRHTKGNSNKYLAPNYKLDKTGKMKGIEGVKIEFFIQYDDTYGIADKLTFEIALKGECMDIFDLGEEPKSSYRPEENVNALLSISSVDARQVHSIIPIVCLNKLIIELERQCRDIANLSEYSEI